MRNNFFTQHIQTKKGTSAAKGSSKSKNKNCFSKSPKHPLENKVIDDPLKPLIRLCHHKLFQEAHRTNGETFLKQSHQSAKRAGKTLPQTGENKLNQDKTIHLVKQNQIGQKNKLKTGKQLEIKIFNPEGDVTKLIDKQIKDQQEEKCLDLIQAVEHLSSSTIEMLKKNSSQKDDTIERLLQSMKQRS